MGRARARALVLATLLAGTASTLMLPAFGASVRAADGPAVGECYLLTEPESRPGSYWPDVAPVACTESHTLEVTETGPLPEDVDAFDFAAQRCGALDVWTAVGVNASTAGIVAHPLRVEPRSFVVAPQAYLCGAVAVSFNGRRPPALVPVDSAFERMRPRVRAALRFCSSAAGGRGPFAPAVTVPCTTRPRWEVRAWIMWSALVDGYPGRAVLWRRAHELCGPGTVYAVPDAAAWAAGMPRTWCYAKYP
jgi:hypothetical protein